MSALQQAPVIAPASGCVGVGDLPLPLALPNLFCRLLPAVHVQATILQGGLLALTPLSILFSAFLFFNALTVTGVRRTA